MKITYRPSTETCQNDNDTHRHIFIHVYIQQIVEDDIKLTSKINSLLQ